MELVAETMGVVPGQLESRGGEASAPGAQARFPKGNTSGKFLHGGRDAVVARLMVKAASEEKIREACEKVVEKAAAGGIEAAKLMFRFLEKEAGGEGREARETVGSEPAAGSGCVESQPFGDEELTSPSPTVDTVVTALSTEETVEEPPMVKSEMEEGRWAGRPPDRSSVRRC